MLTYGEQKTGCGILNSLINKLPVELHLPGYQFCGPRTKLQERLNQGDVGVNPLDSFCRDHDIAYSKSRDDLSARHAADKVLAKKALGRVFARDASLGERMNALLVSNIVNAKRKLGMSLNKLTRRKKTMKKSIKKKVKKIVLRKIVAAEKKAMDTKNEHIQTALSGAREALKAVGGKRNVKFPRVLPIPHKIGGFLPFLVPILTTLAAKGGLASSVTSIVKTIKDIKNAKQQLNENIRHNKAMETVSLGKGLFLKPYKKGLVLHLTKN